ncbi:MAG: MBL fold metallo-hydrolase [Phycisphaerales bacterium]
MTTLDRREFLGLSLAAGAALTLPAFGRTRLDHEYFEFKALADPGRAFSLIGEGGNSLLLNGDGASLLVDCKNAPFGGVLLKDCKALGMHETLTVVNTHHHGDHTAGNHAFLDAAEIIAHEACLPRIDGNMDWYRSMGEQAVRQLRQMPPEKQAIAEGPIMAYARKLRDLTPDQFRPENALSAEHTRLDIGGSEVELHHFGPGHTDNDLVVRIPSLNILHTGDLVFHRVNPFMDANGGCDAMGWLGVLRRVEALCDADTIVMPGHGEVGDRSVIAGQIEYIEKLIEAVQAAVDTGTPRETVVATTFPFQEGFGFDQGRQVANGFVYDMLAADR